MSAAGLPGRAALALACALAGCAPAPAEPRWTSLARDFQPRPLLALAQEWQRAAGLDPAACVEREGSVRVEHTLERAAWRRLGTSDEWRAALPGGAFARGSPGFVQLSAEGTLLRRVAPGAALTAGSFRLEPDALVLGVAGGAEPAATLRLTLRLESGRRTSDGTWQVRAGDDQRAGLAVLSGHPEELECALPPASALSFEARFLSFSGAPVTLRVRLDGERVFETTAPAAELGAGRWIRCALPARARAAAHLAFEVDGPPGQALFFHPLLGPAEIGRPDARPWRAPRPDVVLLLADTFRADGLACGGGAPELAPALNAFAAGALRFRNAHANAAWTLPSIGTLLTGLAPGQHTANTSQSALPGELVTVAEALSASGYRTGAVTDAAFFAPAFGLDQGFESFVSHPPPQWDVDRTVAAARAFLARDDGRPVFLLVHSYRTHNPYRVGPDEDLGPWRELLASGCVLMKSKGQIPRAEWRARLAACRERYAALYREGVRDLDRGFGQVLADAAAHGLLEHGFAILTADHGEALGENDDLFHDGRLWESKLRIPLVVRGPALAPRDVEPTVTLLDLAPTLAAIAGLPADPRWPGTALFAVAAERPACAFLMKHETEVALLEGGRKLLARDLGAFERGEFDAAFDLARDPREEHPITGESWPSALARRHAAFVRELLRPAAEGAAVPLSAAERQQLDQLGYGGDVDDGE